MTIAEGAGSAKINLPKALEALQPKPADGKTTARIAKIKLEKRDAQGNLIEVVELGDNR